MAQYKNDINKELFERIEAYLLNNMDSITRTSFENEMAGDAALSNEVELQRKLTGAIEVLAYKQQRLSAKQSDVSAPVKKFNRAWLYAAAAVLVLIAGTWLYNYTSISSEKIYTKYYSADVGLPIVMSGDNGNYNFYNGMVSYTEGDYTKAIEIWTQIKHNADTLQYYTGMAYMNSNNFQASIDQLLPVAQNTSSLLQSKAIWYLALSYLKIDNKDQSLQWLEKINDNEDAKKMRHDILQLPR